MTVAEYIVEHLINIGVTDLFGIPGGVVLDFLYAAEARKPVITPHLTYHEQTAGFAACGYAQSSNKLGVAYATKGPGFTNLLTPMADAYYDSIPVLFITSHSSAPSPKGIRTMTDQEMDTCDVVRSFTKYAVRIDTIEDVVPQVSKACLAAVGGRKGPVFVDVNAKLWNEILPDGSLPAVATEEMPDLSMDDTISQIRAAKRPVILIGDGINQADAQNDFRELSKKLNLPIVSSRFTHDIVGYMPNYYGYVGSHGIRCANFILSKADLIIALGNRLNFPVHSPSYEPIVKQAKIIRYEIDETELLRDITNSQPYVTDIRHLIKKLVANNYDFGDHSEWMRICDYLYEELKNEDCPDVVLSIASLLHHISEESILVTDIGNNEFWVSRACVLNRQKNRTLYSKSFCALGNGLGKAIGAYYATRKPVVCFIGDQGLQMNIQELQFISQHSLPITIVVINNRTSGMIRDREMHRYKGKCVHTTKDSGYVAPDFESIVRGYGLDSSHFIELSVDGDLELSPQLPKGNPVQKMTPLLEETKYEKLNKL